jgi:hypothetical protein
MIHKEQSSLAGKTVKINAKYAKLAGEDYVVEDWWDRISGRSWRDTEVIAEILYAERIKRKSNASMDDEVLYGKIGILGHLIHISEIEGG